MVIDGQAFYLSDANGDVNRGTPQGLFVGDTRFLDRAELRVNEQPLELLATSQPHSFAATIVLRARTAPGQPSPDLLVVRRRYLGLGFREDIELRNCGGHPLMVDVTIAVDTDFADLFAVKEGRAGPASRSAQAAGHRLQLRHETDGVHRAVELTFQGREPHVLEAGATWRLELQARSLVTLCWDATVSFGQAFLSRHTGCLEQPERMEAVPAGPLLGGGRSRPGHVARGPAPTPSAARWRTLARSRLFDPTTPRRPVIAAGAPWFMTLFGRDSLLSAWMSLPLGYELPLGVLEALAHLQGREVDDARDEQPGRILHELRFTRASTLALLAGDPYYGSADSSPLFVMVLAEACRWGAPLDAVRALVPAADAALGWIEHYGDRDGDGFVEYLRRTPAGLANQGWKDSWDGVRYADGRVAQAPLALCEVQAYVYGAYRARADLARWLGEPPAIAVGWDGRAADLRQAFNDRYWMRRGRGTLSRQWPSTAPTRRGSYHCAVEPGRTLRALAPGRGVWLEA